MLAAFIMWLLYGLMMAVGFGICFGFGWILTTGILQYLAEPQKPGFSTSLVNNLFYFRSQDRCTQTRLSGSHRPKNEKVWFLHLFNTERCGVCGSPKMWKWSQCQQNYHSLNELHIFLRVNLHVDPCRRVPSSRIKFKTHLSWSLLPLCTYTIYNCWGKLRITLMSQPFSLSVKSTSLNC